MEQEITTAIKNLSVTVDALDKASNDEKIYNTELGYFLQQISWEMQKSANQLRDLQYYYG
jgi:hypothetical protein